MNRELKLSEDFRDFPRLFDFSKLLDLKKFTNSMKYFMEKIKLKYFIEKMKYCRYDMMSNSWIRFKNKSKVPRRRTAIFKLIGPCKILSHGQKVHDTSKVTLIITLIIHYFVQSKSYEIMRLVKLFNHKS